MARGDWWRNEKGLTLIELLVSIALTGLIMAPILTIAMQGMRTEAAARYRYSAQEGAHKRFREIIEGVNRKSVDMPGLRGAAELATSADGVAYRVGERVVTYYYLAGGALYRKSCRTGPDCPVAVDPAGGEGVLTNVTEFAVTPDPGGRSIIAVDLGITIPARDKGNPANIHLTTKVNARNLP